MAKSTRAGIVTPDIGVAADVPAVMLAMGQSLEPSLIPRFASAAARNSALTATLLNNDQYDGAGLHCYLADVDQQQQYDGSAWNVVPASGPWSPLTASPNFASVIAPQARVFNGFVELRGMMRHASGVGVNFVPLTVTGNAVVAEVSSAYNGLSTGGPTVTTGGLDGNQAPTAANLAITARLSGGLYIAASATGALYVNLNGLRFPL